MNLKWKPLGFATIFGLLLTMLYVNIKLFIFKEVNLVENWRIISGIETLLTFYALYYAYYLLKGDKDE